MVSSCKLECSSLLFSDSLGEISIPRPTLEGSHQVDNAGVAIAALRELGCTKEYLSNAMERVYWPGRLQRISKGILSPNKAMGIISRIHWLLLKYFFKEI